MADFDYLSERLLPELQWYDNKSTVAKRWFYVLSAAQLGMATAVPVLAALKYEAQTLAVVGGVAAMATGLLTLGQWQHSWVRYRATAEALKHEQYLFLTKSGRYENKTVAELAERCESLISAERVVWSSLMEKVRAPGELPTPRVRGAS
jgi:hypothetical protein